ncbi:hypothetical protein GCM10023148_37390 [Actinokineospora soli]
MATAGWVSGIEMLSEVEKLKAGRAEMEESFRRAYARANVEAPEDLLSKIGAYGVSLADDWDRRIEEAEAEADDLDGWNCTPAVHIKKDQAVRLTSAGWAEIAELLAAEPAKSLPGRLARLHDLGFHDTAIRDASVILECTLRNVVGSTASGLSLIEAFIKLLRSSDQWIEWEILRFRSDLRTVFKFIRNQFAHEIVDVSAVRAKVILERIALLIDAVGDSLSEPNSITPL